MARPARVSLPLPFRCSHVVELRTTGGPADSRDDLVPICNELAVFRRPDRPFAPFPTSSSPLGEPADVHVAATLPMLGSGAPWESQNSLRLPVPDVHGRTVVIS
jgi:hypothetical protein